MSTASASSSPVLRAILRWSLLVTAVLAVVGAVIGFVVAGTLGLISALMGVMLAGLFLGMTAMIILIAGRLPAGPASIPTFFAIVLGGWVVKLVVFIVALLLLRGQPWIQPQVFFFAVLASVVASLVVDMVVMARSRVPYVGDVALPTSVDDPETGPGGR